MHEEDVVLDFAGVDTTISVPSLEDIDHLPMVVWHAVTWVRNPAAMLVVMTDALNEILKLCHYGFAPGEETDQLILWKNSPVDASIDEFIYVHCAINDHVRSFNLAKISGSLAPFE